MDELEIFESFEAVAEMTSDPAGLVRLDPSTLAAITEGDDDPRFATFVIESGWSKSKRFWGPELFQNVAEQINNSDEPIVGYMGHIRPEDDPYKFPEIQLQWLGAKVIQQGDKAKLAVKAYVLPGTKGRDYLKRGLVKTVSWRGKVAQEAFQQGVRVKKFLIESIDLSRPRAAGMSARMVGALSSEMESEGGNSVKPDEIAALQENELRAHNPNLVSTIEASARKPLEDKVSEMTAEVTAVEPVKATLPEFRKLLNLGDDVNDENVLLAAAKAIREAGKSLMDSVLSSVLDKKLKGGDEKDRALVKRLIASEMRGKGVSLTGDADADEKVVMEMVNEIINSDDELKQSVSEMEDTPAAPPGTSQDRGTGGPRELKPGTTTANIRVRSATR